MAQVERFGRARDFSLDVVRQCLALNGAARDDDHEPTLGAAFHGQTNILAISALRAVVEGGGGFSLLLLCQAAHDDVLSRWGVKGQVTVERRRDTRRQIRILDPGGTLGAVRIAWLAAGFDLCLRRFWVWVGRVLAQKRSRWVWIGRQIHFLARLKIG